MRRLALMAIGIMIYGTLSGKPGLVVVVGILALASAITYSLSPRYGGTHENHGRCSS